MRASESAAALRAMGEVEDDAAAIGRDGAPHAGPGPAAHAGAAARPETLRHAPGAEETKDLAEPARWAPCPVEQRKWSHSIVVLNPSD